MGLAKDCILRENLIILNTNLFYYIKIKQIRMN